MTQPVLVPDDTTTGDLRKLAEVTSPSSDDTVYNDRVVKPVQYAKSGVPIICWSTRSGMPGPSTGSAASRVTRFSRRASSGKSIPLPAPFGFSVDTAEWPAA